MLRLACSLLVVCLVAHSQTLGSPKAPATDLLNAVSGDTPAANLTTTRGEHLLLARYSKPGARAIQLRIEQIRLPESAALFVYSLDTGGSVGAIKGPWFGASAEQTVVLPGDTAYIEVQWGSDAIPGDLPFDVTEVTEAQSEEAVDMVSVENPEDLLIEGDILVHPSEAASPKNARKYGVGISYLSYRWPGGVVPYTISSDVPTQSRITDAIAHWNQQLAGSIRLEPRTNQSNYVNFVRGSGCSSYVGMVSLGPQPIRLADACSKGSVIHEIGHALGLWHEQSRADRNSYVRVLWSNILAGTEMNFNQNIDDGDDINSYDHGSIMHYGTHSFSSNGQPTLETIPAGIPIGQRVQLSSGDIAAIRSLYGYTSSAPTTVSVTFNSNPAGLQVRVDGLTYAMPRTFQWTVGSVHTVEALDQQPQTGVKYTFARWSDNGTRTHSITTSSSVTSYTATFSVSYLVAVSASTGGTATISPVSTTGYYAKDSSVDLKATAAAGYCFSSWNDLVAGTPSSTRISVTRAYSPRANFAAGSITLSPTGQAIPASGGSAQFSLSATSVCRWQAASTVAWITITSSKIGVGAASIAYTVAANNTGASRTGTIIIEGRSFTVSQAAAAAPSPQAVTSLVLMRADLDQPVAGFNPIVSGSTLNLSSIGSRALNIRTTTNPATVGSVRFELNGAVAGTDYTVPYDLVSDTSGSQKKWTPALGLLVIKATPYSSTGTAGTPLTITLNVVNRPGASDEAGSETPAEAGQALP